MYLETALQMGVALPQVRRGGWGQGAGGGAGAGGGWPAGGRGLPLPQVRPGGGGGGVVWAGAGAGPQMGVGARAGDGWGAGWRRRCTWGWRYRRYAGDRGPGFRALGLGCRRGLALPEVHWGCAGGAGLTCRWNGGAAAAAGASSTHSHKRAQCAHLQHTRAHTCDSPILAAPVHDDTPFLLPPCHFVPSSRNLLPPQDYHSELLLIYLEEILAQVGSTTTGSVGWVVG